MGTLARSMEKDGFGSKNQRHNRFANKDFDELESGRFFMFFFSN
jgi:hypothetical protein